MTVDRRNWKPMGRGRNFIFDWSGRSDALWTLFDAHNFIPFGEGGDISAGAAANVADTEGSRVAEETRDERIDEVPT